MTRYEYKVLPAPMKGLKVKGARTTEARFAHALMEVMNQFGRDGWEYQRTDTLPCEERVGLTGRTTKFQNMLVFRRVIADRTTVEAPTEAEVAIRPTEAAHHLAEEAAGDQPAAARDAAPQVEGSVAARLAATLSAKPREGATPPLRAVPDAGKAPPLGAPRPSGLFRPRSAEGVPAE